MLAARALVLRFGEVLFEAAVRAQGKSAKRGRKGEQSQGKSTSRGFTVGFPADRADGADQRGS